MRNKERASWDLGTGSHGMLGEVIVAKDIEEVKKLKILLNIEFDMKDLRVAGKILDMEIIRVQKHVSPRRLVAMSFMSTKHLNSKRSRDISSDQFLIMSSLVDSRSQWRSSSEEADWAV
nr:hypothetical protein [Tanacetum cinerariifolium]